MSKRAEEVVTIKVCWRCPYRAAYQGQCVHPRSDDQSDRSTPERGAPPEWCPLRHTDTVLRVEAPIKRRRL